MKHCAAVSIALLFCFSAAMAQTQTAAGVQSGAVAQSGAVQSGAVAQTGAVQSGNHEDTFSTTLSGEIHLRTIAGAPFSADVVKESARALPDGTQVPVVTHGRMFRDGEGRTRSEIELFSAAASAPLRYVIIVDPVRQVSMALDTQSKTATVWHLPGASMAEQPLKMVARPDSGRVPANPPAIVEAEDLGTSTVETFQVTGIRVTRLKEGAENRVEESWFSPELKIELQARIAGPRLGETITRLANIVAAEPDRSLFEVPADYVLKAVSYQQSVISSVSVTSSVSAVSNQ